MQSKCAVQLEVFMFVLCMEKPNSIEVSVAPLPCCAQSACTGMAHPSVYPPLPPESWILLHASQVSYSQFHIVNRSRTHTLIPQVSYNHRSPLFPALLLCLLGTSAYIQHLLACWQVQREVCQWGAPHTCTPCVGRRYRPSSAPGKRCHEHVPVTWGLTPAAGAEPLTCFVLPHSCCFSGCPLFLSWWLVAKTTTPPI